MTGFTEEEFGPDVTPPPALMPRPKANGADTVHPQAASSPAAAPWPVLNGAAYHGLAGEMVRAIEPHTEADPVALLVNCLVYFGNIIGRGPFFLHEDTSHYTNLNAAEVGDTSSGKGVAKDRVTAIFRAVDPEWARHKGGGISSGEGLLHVIRDAVYAMRKGVLEMTDPGVEDKRQMAEETEFARVLTVMKRDGNSISELMREAWDCNELLQSKVRHLPLAVTNGFISVLAHITPDELRKRLDVLTLYNGFANRFLFVCVRRSKDVPRGRPLDVETRKRLTDVTRRAIEKARSVGQVMRTPAADGLWDTVYPELATRPPGPIGVVTARARPQVVRLSLIYALLDHAPAIDVEHLNAALALWRYCEASARTIFDPVAYVHDEHDHAAVVLRGLKNAGAEGMAMREIHDLFSRHLGTDRLHSILERFEKNGAARCEKKNVLLTGRKRETWYAI